MFSQPIQPGNFQSFIYPEPLTVNDWDEEKPVLRKKLRRLLGDLPPMFTPKPTTTEIEKREGYRLEKFYFDNLAGSMVYGYLIVPEGRKEPGPAILYNHYHGGEYDNGKEEVLKPWITAESPAKALADAGYVVLAIDAYGFGERQTQGPSGEKDSGRRTEEALFKNFIWQGKTLWGMMVRDDILALNYLLSVTDTETKLAIVDPERVGAVGMSMGSTRTWWLAAMDERIKAAVSVACLTRYQNLIRAQEINQHGIYYFVPDLLKEGVDMEAVVGLIAPRPLLTLTGSQDGGSPVDGVNFINKYVARIYDLYGKPELFRGVVYDGVGHTYTPEMWGETVGWFERYLNK